MSKTTIARARRARHRPRRPRVAKKKRRAPRVSRAVSFLPSDMLPDTAAEAVPTPNGNTASTSGAAPTVLQAPRVVVPPQRVVGGLGSITATEAIADAANGPARRMVIAPIVAREETSSVHSQPRDGKTWVFLAGGIAVARGDKLAGRLATEQTNVLYTTNEDGQRQIARRLQMLLKGLSMKRAPDGLRLFVGRGLWLDDVIWQQRLIDEVRDLRIGLVIFDPLRSLTGCVDKGPSELQPFSRFQRRFINETGCAIWNGHHETKPSLGLPDDRRPAQRSSGGGLFSTMDAPISIERIDDTKSRFVPDGFKHAETPAPFIVERIIASDCAFLTVTDAPDRQTGADLALVDEVRDYLRQHPNSAGSQVARELKKQKDRVLSALDGLRKAGEVRYVKSGRSHLWNLV